MSDLLTRIDAMEARLKSVEAELRDLREASGTSAATAAPPPPMPAAPPPPEPVGPVVAAPPPAAPAPVRYSTAGPIAAPPPAPAAPPAAPAPRAPRPPRIQLPEVSAADLVGARGLAWVGGLVTLLGIILFFVLAVNRGWVSPELRVALGAIVSAGLYAAAWRIRRRLGELQAALAAAGAGIAGAYATLFAATALYDLIPSAAALPASAAIAAVGIATALAWNAQITAVLGLAGAMLGPELIEGGDPSAVGATYTAVVFAAALVVALRRRWAETLAVAGVLCVVETGLVVDMGEPGESALDAALLGMFALLYLAAGLGARLRGGDGQLARVLPTAFLLASGGTSLAILAGLDLESVPTGTIAVATVLWLAYFASGVGTQIASGESRLARIPTALVLGSVSFAYVGTHLLFDGRDVGLALLEVSAVTAAPILFAPRLPGRRNLWTVLWAASLSVLAVAVGNLLGGSGLVLAWAAQGGLIAWVAVIAREQRMRFAAAGYLALAAGHTLIFEAPPVELFRDLPSPQDGIPAVLFVALGTAVFALAARAGGFRPKGTFEATAAVSGVGFLYAASFALLALFPFEQAQIAVTSLWAGVALALLLAGLARSSRELHTAGLVLFGIAVAKLLLFDLIELTGTNGDWSLFAVGVLALAAGYAEGVAGERVLPFVAPSRLTPTAIVLLPAAALGIGAALSELLDGSTAGVDDQGAALLVLAAVYGALAATVFGRPGRRDLATLLWGVGAAVAGYGFAQNLLEGDALVLAWAALGAVLAGLGRRTRDERFLLGSVALVGAALWLALVDAPPRALFEKSAHPAAGLAGLVFAGLGVAVLAFCTRKAKQREAAAWLAGGIALYAGSLAILGLFEWPAANSPGAVSDAFQRGHTAVSATWGLVGLALLVAGLRRARRPLRIGGLALFGLALVKLFVYDLANLSSLARAFSFLAVGVVLLVAALLYQRLTEEPGAAQS